MSLKALPAPESGLHFTSQSVPWQRVINAKGMISHRCVVSSVLTPVRVLPFFSPRLVSWLIVDMRSEPGGATRQADALRLEGVEVTTDNMGEMHVSFPQYGWFPKRLPSEEADDWL